MLVFGTFPCRVWQNKSRVSMHWGTHTTHTQPSLIKHTVIISQPTQKPGGERERATGRVTWETCSQTITHTSRVSVCLCMCFWTMTKSDLTISLGFREGFSVGKLGGGVSILLELIPLSNLSFPALQNNSTLAFNSTSTFKTKMNSLQYIGCFFFPDFLTSLLEIDGRGALCCSISFTLYSFIKRNKVSKTFWVQIKTILLLHSKGLYTQNLLAHRWQNQRIDNTPGLSNLLHSPINTGATQTHRDHTHTHRLYTHIQFTTL